VLLLSGLCLCGKKTLVKYFKAVTGRELTTGIIAVIQSFGNRIKFLQHLHFLVSEGGQDREGPFHLKLTFMAERPPPPQAVQQELAAEDFAEYF